MDDRLEYIENFLAGKLTQNEEDAFNEKLEVDPDFKRLFEEHNSFLRGLEFGFNKELKAQLQEEDRKMAPFKLSKGPTKQAYFILSGIAAGIVLLITFVYLFNNGESNHLELYASNFEAYPNIEMPLSRSDQSIQNPYALYERGEYQAALEKLNLLASEDPLAPAPLFYAGQCQLILEDYGSALNSFKVLSEMADSKYSKPVTWYLGLTYLRLDKRTEATEVFEVLSNGSGKYAEQSKAILMSL